MAKGIDPKRRSVVRLLSSPGVGKCSVPEVNRRAAGPVCGLVVGKNH
jgi:hypothetical protein